jgi:hypothetical protein
MCDNSIIDHCKAVVRFEREIRISGVANDSDREENACDQADDLFRKYFVDNPPGDFDIVTIECLDAIATCPICNVRPLSYNDLVMCQTCQERDDSYEN